MGATQKVAGVIFLAGLTLSLASASDRWRPFFSIKATLLPDCCISRCKRFASHASRIASSLVVSNWLDDVILKASISVSRQCYRYGSLSSPVDQDGAGRDEAVRPGFVVLDELAPANNGIAIHFARIDQGD